MMAKGKVRTVIILYGSRLILFWTVETESMPEDLINETSIQVLWGNILLQMAIDLSVRLSGAYALRFN